MRIYTDIKLSNYESLSWFAGDILNELTDEQMEKLDDVLTEKYPSGMTEEMFEDFLMENTDTIAQWLGYNHWCELSYKNRHEWGELNGTDQNI